MASVLHRIASAALVAAVTENPPRRRAEMGAVRAIAAGFALGTVGRVAVSRGTRLARGERPEEPSCRRGTRRSNDRLVADPVRTEEPSPEPPAAATDKPAKSSDARPAPEARGPSGDDAMTRSEEDLDVRTVRRVRGRVRLHRYVVTEEVHRTIPVRREELRIEELPASEDPAANANAGTVAEQHDSEVHEMVLHEEVPVIEMRVRPRERVRIVKETRRGQAPVVEEVRAERIEAEGDLER